MKHYLPLISLLIFAITLSGYLSSFWTAAYYTTPTAEEAPIRVTANFSRYYTKELGIWTPFTHYHTIISGYYSKTWYGKWEYHTDELKLAGNVEEYMRYSWE